MEKTLPHIDTFLMSGLCFLPMVRWQFWPSLAGILAEAMPHCKMSAGQWPATFGCRRSAFGWVFGRRNEMIAWFAAFLLAMTVSGNRETADPRSTIVGA
jgi:hypothetical protein